MSDIKPRRALSISNVARKWFTLYGTFIIMYKNFLDVSISSAHSNHRKVRRRFVRARYKFRKYKRYMLGILSYFVRIRSRVVNFKFLKLRHRRMGTRHVVRWFYRINDKKRFFRQGYKRGYVFHKVRISGIIRKRFFLKKIGRRVKSVKRKQKPRI
jgi:hypothetical protein